MSCKTYQSSLVCVNVSEHSAIVDFAILHVCRHHLRWVYIDLPLSVYQYVSPYARPNAPKTLYYRLASWYSNQTGFNIEKVISLAFVDIWYFLFVSRVTLKTFVFQACTLTDNLLRMLTLQILLFFCIICFRENISSMFI